MDEQNRVQAAREDVEKERADLRKTWESKDSHAIVKLDALNRSNALERVDEALRLGHTLALASGLDDAPATVIGVAELLLRERREEEKASERDRDRDSAAERAAEGGPPGANYDDD